MAAINFPDAPTNGQIFESGGMSWTYVAGIGWTLNSAIVEAGSGFTFIADTMPLPVNVGDTWFDSSTGASGGTSWVAIEEGPAGASEKVWVQFAPGTASLMPDSVDNSYLANMPANTFKGNNTGSSANPKDLTVAQLQTALGISPLRQAFYAFNSTEVGIGVNPTETTVATYAFSAQDRPGTYLLTWTGFVWTTQDYAIRFYVGATKLSDFRVSSYGNYTSIAASCAAGIPAGTTSVRVALMALTSAGGLRVGGNLFGTWAY
jgi:hypothetical protein